MITHRNILTVTQAFMAANQAHEWDEMVSYLPSGPYLRKPHITVSGSLVRGTVNFGESMDTLPQNLREVSPTIFASVPRIWEKFGSMIEIRMSDSTLLKKPFIAQRWRLGCAT